MRTRVDYEIAYSSNCNALCSEGGCSQITRATKLPHLNFSQLKMSFLKLLSQLRKPSINYLWYRIQGKRIQMHNLDL